MLLLHVQLLYVYNFYVEGRENEKRAQCISLMFSCLFLDVGMVCAGGGKEKDSAAEKHMEKLVLRFTDRQSGNDWIYLITQDVWKECIRYQKDMLKAIGVEPQDY